MRITDADIDTYVLWQRLLRTEPAEPTCVNRDRVVLSEGHIRALTS